MNGKRMLYRDQWGNSYVARTVRELRRLIGGGRVSKIYRDTANGGAVHVGYAVGAHWCAMYAPVELPA